MRTLGANEHTAFAYIKALDFVQIVPVPNSSRKHIRLKGLYDHLLLQAQGITTPRLRADVERALPLLTEEYIDVGLFQIGKQFELALKGYWETAIRFGRARPNTLKEGKTWRLADMVDAAKNGGAVLDSTVLHILREERNERAHGAIPSVEDRRLMLKTTELIVGTYIDYIKRFDDLRREL